MTLLIYIYFKVKHFCLPIAGDQWCVKDVVCYLGYSFSEQFDVC